MLGSVCVTPVNRPTGGLEPVPAGSVVPPGSAQPPARAGPLPTASSCRDGWVDFEGVADGREGVTSVITRDGISTLHPWPWSIAIKRFNPWAVGVPSPTLGIPPKIATATRDPSRRIL